MKKKIFFRTDGSSQIGLGHLVRCTALAYILKEDFEISFVCKIVPDELMIELNIINIKIYFIENDDDFLSFLNYNDIAILDGYNFDIEFQRKIKNTGAKLVCIDDLNNGEFEADLIISQTPGVKAIDYKAQAYTKFALGLEYSLLRPAFLEQTSKPRLIDKLDTLLICFGGSDSLNLTVKTLKVVTNKYPFIKIIIVTGAAYNQFDNLFPLIRLHKRIEHYNNVDAEKMVSLMLESNLSIAPSSSILLELFSVGVPAITGYYVENQKTGSAALSDIGLAISCGDMNNDYSKKLNDILKNYTLDVGIQMVKNQKAIKWAGKNYYINIFKAL